MKGAELTPGVAVDLKTELEFWQDRSVVVRLGDDLDLVRSAKPPENRWKIVRSAHVWNDKTRTFVYEPSPSNRTAEHLAETRFTFDEAMTIVHGENLFDPSKW